MTTTRQAYRNLDPCFLSSADLKMFYCERPDFGSQLLNAKRSLELFQQPQVVLLSGCRGTGKTTELHMLSSHLAEHYTVIFAGEGAFLMSMEPTIADMLLVLLASLFEKAPPSLAQPPILKNILKQLNIDSARLEHSQVFASLQSLRYSSTSTSHVRNQLPHLHAALREAVADVATDIAHSTGKPLLLIADDMERLTPTVAQNLLIDHGESWRGLPFSVILTVPFSVFYSAKSAPLLDCSAAVSILPIQTRSRDGKVNHEGLAFLKQVISRRLPLEIIADDALSVLCEASGGVLRQLLVFLRGCLISQANAVERPLNEHCITGEIARRVVKREMSHHLPMVRDDMEILRIVSRTKEPPAATEAELRLLSLGSILQYEERDGSVWYDVSPLLEPLVKFGA